MDGEKAARWAAFFGWGVCRDNISIGGKSGEMTIEGIRFNYCVSRIKLISLVL